MYKKYKSMKIEHCLSIPKGLSIEKYCATHDGKILEHTKIPEFSDIPSDKVLICSYFLDGRRKTVILSTNEEYSSCKKDESVPKMWFFVPKAAVKTASDSNG